MVKFEKKHIINIYNILRYIEYVYNLLRNLDWQRHFHHEDIPATAMITLITLNYKKQWVTFIVLVLELLKTANQPKMLGIMRMIMPWKTYWIGLF